MGKLQGKVALVTGGGSGMGLAIARSFLNEGAKVAITGRDPAKLQAAAAALGHVDRLMTHPADVTRPESVKTLVTAVRDKFGPISVLVNNAGTNIKERTVKELTVEAWDMLVRTNLDGAFYCIREVLPLMREQRDGVIVNISSVSGKRGYPLAGAGYVAGKFGLAGLGLCLAAEEKDTGVRVSTIFPGEVDTPILAARPTPVTEEQRKVILQPDDVAAAVLFVATLPPHVSVPELIIKPTAHVYV